MPTGTNSSQGVNELNAGMNQSHCISQTSCIPRTTLFAQDTLTKTFTWIRVDIKQHCIPIPFEFQRATRAIRLRASVRTRTPPSARGERARTVQLLTERSRFPLCAHRTYTHAGRANCSAMHYETRALHTCSSDAQDAMSGPRSTCSPQYRACTRAASFQVEPNDQRGILLGLRVNIHCEVGDGALAPCVEFKK